MPIQTMQSFSVFHSCITLVPNFEIARPIKCIILETFFQDQRFFQQKWNVYMNIFNYFQKK